MTPSNTTSSSTHFLEPQCAERWLGLGYTYSGIFILDGTDLNPGRAVADFDALYLAARSNRQRKFTRGLARFLLIPVYCAPSFSKPIRDYLYGYHRPSRWAISMHPVLFNTHTNTIEAKDAAQNNRLSISWYLERHFSDGVSCAACHFGLQPELTKKCYDELAAKPTSDRNS